MKYRKVEKKQLFQALTKLEIPIVSKTQWVNVHKDMTKTVSVIQGNEYDAYDSLSRWNI